MTDHEGQANPWELAKDIIIDAFHDGLITAEMSAKDVYNLNEYSEVFQTVRWECFRSNYNRLKKKGFERQKKREVNPWNIAKPIAHEYYVSGIITDDISIDEIHALDEFKDVDKERFKANFKNLKKRIKKDQARADSDLVGYFNDMKIHTLAKDIEQEWHGSEAERLLRDDVEKNRHQGKKPRELRETREEYKKFDLETFRLHFFQEKRRKLDSNYWLVKKRKKAMKKEAKLQGKPYIDNDFYDPVLQFNSLNDFP